MPNRPTLYVAGGYASGFVAQCIKAEAERTGARIVGKLDLGERRKPRDTERERATIEARLSAPKLSTTDQADSAHLPLFIAANEPRFL